MKVLQVFVYCQFMMMCSLSAQSAKLASSIDFFFDTIMVGQPVYFNFTLKNTQTNPVAVFYEPEGKDWNELGRDESFDVNFCSSSGSTLRNRVAKLKNAIMIFNGEVDFFSTDAKETTSQHNNLLRKAFYGIIQFEDAKCIPFLLEHKNHDDSYLRIRIIKELYARDKKIAQPIVLEYLKDEDQRVRATAEMYQKLMNNQ